MPKRTWDNVECTFNTANDSNTLPDSKYVVTASSMQRWAFVNAGPGRDASQTLSGNPAICYLDPGSALAAAVFAQGDDTKIHVLYVDQDLICVKVDGVPQGGETTGFAYRRPTNGFTTFDFHNADGQLSHVHVGHPVKNVAPGSGGGISDANKALQTVRNQVRAKANVLAELTSTDQKAKLRHVS